MIKEKDHTPGKYYLVSFLANNLLKPNPVDQMNRKRKNFDTGTSELNAKKAKTVRQYLSSDSLLTNNNNGKRKTPSPSKTSLSTEIVKKSKLGVVARAESDKKSLGETTRDVHGIARTSLNSILTGKLTFCTNFRPYVFRQYFGWPFEFKTSMLELKDDISDADPKYHAFHIGGVCPPTCRKLCMYTTNVVERETSQGKVSMLEIRVNGTNSKIVVKSDPLEPNCSLAYWINSSKFIKGSTSNHRIVSSAYCDALCSTLLSYLVERHASLHFPICYGSVLSQTTFFNGNVQKHGKSFRMLLNKVRVEECKRSGNPFRELQEKSQLIFMEHFDCDLQWVLDNEIEIGIFWSAIFQVAAALNVARNYYQLIHNDLHICNVMARKVSKDSFIYYYTESGNFYRVPTYGYVFVLIDFGRSVIAPWNDQRSFVSSEFSPSGNCAKLICDNPNIDMVRLCICISRKALKLPISSERANLINFCKKRCENKEKIDIIQKILLAKGDISYFLDVYPRIYCFNASPFEIGASIGKRYLITRDCIPDLVYIYKLYSANSTPDPSQ